MNRKQRNIGKLSLRASGYYMERCYPKWYRCNAAQDHRRACPVTQARRRARNRQLSRYYFGLKSKRHARRFAEVNA